MNGLWTDQWTSRQMDIHILHVSMNGLKTDHWTEQWKEGQTDGRTDTPSYRDVRMHLNAFLNGNFDYLTAIKCSKILHH